MVLGDLIFRSLWGSGLGLIGRQEPTFEVPGFPPTSQGRLVAWFRVQGLGLEGLGFRVGGFRV